MRLLRLRASRLRNLADLDLQPSAAITLFNGPNGSGKSSLLEAVHILSRGKSFRTQYLARAVRHGADSMVITADIGEEAAGKRVVGVEFEAAPPRLRMRAGGDTVQRASDLAGYLPLVTVHQESHRVFTEGPAYRRQFLDWGLFHVEPSFLSLWQRNRRAVKQRNAALQQSGSGAEAWDADLVASALEIDRLRRHYLDRFMPLFHGLTGLLSIPERIEARYAAGWEEGADYADLLKRALSGDRAIGHTRYGPHRADVVFTVDGRRVNEVLSRGQMKTLICALYLAQAEMHVVATDRRPVLLMDDLAAELDNEHRHRLIARIDRTGLQTLITSSETGPVAWLVGIEHRAFHVEHGAVKEVI